MHACTCMHMHAQLYMYAYRYRITCNAGNKHLVLGKTLDLTSEQAAIIQSVHPNAKLQNALIYECLLLDGIVYSTTMDSIVSFDKSIGKVIKFASFCYSSMSSCWFYNQVLPHCNRTGYDYCKYWDEIHPHYSSWRVCYLLAIIANTFIGFLYLYYSDHELQVKHTKEIVSKGVLMNFDGHTYVAQLPNLLEKTYN